MVSCVPCVGGWCYLRCSPVTIFTVHRLYLARITCNGQLHVVGFLGVVTCTGVGWPVLWPAALDKALDVQDFSLSCLAEFFVAKSCLIWSESVTWHPRGLCSAKFGQQSKSGERLFFLSSPFPSLVCAGITGDSFPEPLFELTR